MIVEYGSPAHIIFILAALVICALTFLILRKFGRGVQKYAILALMTTNVAQHFLKSVLYPHLGITGFTALSTAYNVCALLILLSPIALLVRYSPLRDFVFYIGSVAGIIAIAIPYWSIGKPASDPDYIRSFICHTLLFVTSMLPLLLGLHKPSYKCFLRLGIYFLFAILAILINDAVCILVGIYPGVENLDFFEALAVANPIWSFGAPPEFSRIAEIISVLTPREWEGIPVLWYAIPMYAAVTLVAFPICVLVDKKHFKSDLTEKFTKK